MKKQTNVRRPRLLRSGLLLLAMLLTLLPLLVACGAAEDAMFDNGFAPNHKAEADFYYDAEYPTADSTSGGLGYDSLYSESTESSTAGSSAPAGVEKKKIKMATVEAETKTFDQTLDALEKLLAGASGEIESQSLRNRNYVSAGSYYGRQMELVIRIPADRFDAFLSELGDAMNVLSSTSSTKDVSDTYYKIADVLETLETERDSLLTMMRSLETAKEYELWYTLETRLSELEQQIAVYRGQLARLDNQVDYSTLTLILTEVTEYSPAVQKVTFGERISDAFVRSWRNFASNAQDFFVFLVGALPTLLVLAAVGSVVAVVLCITLRKTARKKPVPPASSDSEQNPKE